MTSTPNPSVRHRRASGSAAAAPQAAHQSAPAAVSPVRKTRRDFPWALLIVLLALAAALVLGATPVLNALANQPGRYTYELSADGASCIITGYASVLPVNVPLGLITLTVPDTLGVFVVTGIGESAFAEASLLDAVVLPSGVTEIGGNAFAGCSTLSAINLPAGLSAIGGNAFGGCPQLILTVAEGSYAHQYADAQGLPCRPE